MIGYKALDAKMCAANGDKMQYELNKEYIMSDNICLRACGYHYCKDIIDAVYYYSNINNIRIFEIDTLDGTIDVNDGSNLYCSNKIKLIRELSKEEVDKYFENNSDVLINDTDWIVRAAVARQGYGLDVLINDPHWCVRLEVAKQGYGLDTLINDSDWIVRAAVAKQGYGLDVLINDTDSYVRKVVKAQIKRKF